MRIKIILAIAVAAAGFLLISDCTSPNAGNGSQVPNSVSAMLYNPGGSPAVHAKVRFYLSAYNPRTGGLGKKLVTVTDSAVTDANGNYVAKLDPGTYNVLAAGDSGVVYQDSITVVKDSTIHPPADTLKAPGSIRGKVRLQPGDDARTVFIIFMGTNALKEPDDSLGNFTADNLAQGNYRVRILTILDAYVPKDTVLSVTAGKVDSLTHDIVLQYTGIPTPKNVTISYDTLKQIVTVTWSKADTSLVSSYNVYRRNVGLNTVLARINASPVTDTSYRDSTGVQDSTYEYAVANVNKSATEGTRSATLSVLVRGAFVFRHEIGSAGSGTAQYRFPIAVAVSSTGTVIVAESKKYVSLFDTSGNFVRKDSGFVNPAGVALKNDGTFFILDNSTMLISHLDASGNVLTQFGGQGDSAGKFGSQNAMWTLAIASNGDLYIPDFSNNRIQVLDSNGGFKHQLSFASPTSVVFLDVNRLAIGSASGIWKISEVDTNGIIVKEWNTLAIWSLSLTPLGNIIAIQSGAANLNNIMIFNPNGDFLAKFGRTGTGENQFTYLRGIALYITHKFILTVDDGAEKVKMFSMPDL